jgi:hypothetical protein
MARGAGSRSRRAGIAMGPGSHSPTLCSASQEAISPASTMCTFLVPPEHVKSAEIEIAKGCTAFGWGERIGSQIG